MTSEGFVADGSSEARAVRSLDPHLTLAARIALYAVASLSLATLIATWNEIGAFDEFIRSRSASSFVAVGEAGQFSDGFVTLVVWVGLASAVLTIVWWHHSYRAILGARPRGLRWSTGWAVGGWLIPLANLVIAKLVLDEIDRVSAAAAAGDPSWRDRQTTRITSFWWAFWVGGLVVGITGTALVSAQLDTPSFDANSYRLGLVALLVAHACSMVAAFLGTASLRVIGDRLHRA